jgi:hypothetical protein
MTSRSLSWLLVGAFIAGVVGQARGAEPIDIKPAPLPDGTISQAIADHFVDALRKNQYEFLSEDKLKSLHTEIADFSSRCKPAPLPSKDRESLLTAVDRYVPQHFPNKSPGSPGQYRSASDAERAYLTFRDVVNTFKWQLWRALIRRPLSAEQLKQRQTQHDWLRRFIDSVPARPGDAYPPGVVVSNARAWATARLEETLADPLGLMYDPMPDLQFELFKKLMSRSAGNGLVATVLDVPVRALGARAHLSASPDTAYSYPFDIVLPFDDEVRSIYGGSEAQLAFASNTRFRGQEAFLDSQTRPVFDISSGVYTLPARPKLGTFESLRSWWESRFKTGDFAYDDAKAKVLALRDAKIAELKVVSWFEADRVPDSKLRELIAKDGKSTISVKDLPPVNGVRPAKAAEPRFFIVIQSHEGRLAVIDLQNRESGQIHFLSRVRPGR